MALKNIYSINVDIKRRMTSVVPTFKQGDAATLIFRVYDDGVLLNLNNVNSEITFTLPNGETLLGNPQLINGELVYEFTGLEMIRPGKVITILSIMRNNTMVSVPPFSCFIFDSMRGEALSYIGILQDLIKETQDLGLNFGGLAESVAESLELAEDQLEELHQVIQTTLADINTWDGNEQQRVSRENTRVTNEQSRVSAETTRTQSENARANAENSRVQAESNRATTFNNQMQQTNTKINEMNVLIENLESFDYSPSTTYDFPNLITYNGSTYMALKQVTGITPTNDKVNYRLIAQRGVDGTGSVSKVNGISPDVNGNVVIDVGDSEELNIHKKNSSPQKHIEVVSNMPTNISESGIVIKVDGSHSDVPGMVTVDELNNRVTYLENFIDENELPTPTQPTTKLLEEVCFYYNSPHLIHNATTIDEAAEKFAQFDIVILGDRVQIPTHWSYARSVSVINKLFELKPDIQLFGYVPIGAEGTPSETNNLTMEMIQSRIDDWHTIGATGIFLDEFGYDYFVTRERQNACITYTRSKGMNVFANSWQQRYVFSNESMPLSWLGGFDGNPNQIPAIIGENDYTLFENMLFKYDDETIDGVRHFYQIGQTQERIGDMLEFTQTPQPAFNGKSWRKHYGTKGVALDSIIDESQQMHDEGYLMALSCGLDGYSASTASWGSSSLKPLYPKYKVPPVKAQSLADVGTPVVSAYGGISIARVVTQIGESTVDVTYTNTSDFDYADGPAAGVVLSVVLDGNVPSSGKTWKRPVNPPIGFQYYDTDLGITYRYDGNFQWKELLTQDIIAPTVNIPTMTNDPFSPILGQIWLRTDTPTAPLRIMTPDGIKGLLFDTVDLSTIIQTNLLTYYNVAQGVSGSAWQNIVPTRPHAILNNTTVSENGIVVISSGNRIIVPIPPEIREGVPTSPFTLEVRLAATGFSTAIGTGYDATIAPNIYTYLSMSGTSLHTNFPNTEGTATVSNSFSVSSNPNIVDTFLTITYVYDGEYSLSVYKNGTLLDTRTLAQKIRLNTAPNLSFYPSSSVSNTIKFIRIYNRALTPAEVTTNISFGDSLGF